MEKPEKTYFNWSTGKDAALALYKLQQNDSYHVAALLCAVNAHFDRVSMHGVRRDLLEAQAVSLALPLHTIELPEMPDMESYERIMKTTVDKLHTAGFTTSAFGDIFLEDLKKYREENLAKVGMKAVFPLWRKDTKSLLKEFLDLGFKSIVVCVKSDVLDKSFAGRIIDEQFIDDLPDNVDCCGENGEFHTFCFDGPIFQKAIEFTVGEKTYKSYKVPKDDKVHSNEKDMGFWFCDLKLK